ncbi:unnamed protein product [Aphanomyces euteiches]|uniref:WIBG Mago-binding domain-containing protein n=1 Tax=Aphanomyces euteiches TaxID=100861 RepID=A0A6G0XPW5_9STRA|nr:hypothetical protein Ae201684_002731 [Aphanomyces euteiches]KAH9092970.1 hypothetical protein Ae201684P_008636 [Aphanomyces euteiches]KAH9131879.1 hypothetical protein AeRB84_021594 [Aphanomyces euteiches]
MQPRKLPLGAVQGEDGQVVIPSSTRADGSVRKEIRVRKGYVPQEEQPIYRPRAQREAAALAGTADARAPNVANSDEDLSKHLDAINLDENKPTMKDQVRRLPLGAVQTETGDVVIPPPTRPDGSVRKEIRVRAGFVPQDEQPVYRPRASRGSNDSSNRSSGSFRETKPTSRGQRDHADATTQNIDRVHLEDITPPNPRLSPPSRSSVAQKHQDEEGDASTSRRNNDRGRGRRQQTRRPNQVERHEKDLAAAAPSTQETQPKRSSNTLRVIEL